MPKPFVYFDMGNVLMFFDHGQVGRNLAASTGVDPVRANQVIFDTGLQWRYERGEVSDKEYCDALRSTLNISMDDSELLDHVSDIFLPNTSIFPLVGQLKRFGFDLGVFSNTCDSHWNFIQRRQMPILSLFEKYALSHKIGAMKPDISAYQAAQQIADRSADEIIFPLRLFPLMSSYTVSHLKRPILKGSHF